MLPIRRYGIADGLAHGRVNFIHQDAKGYLWFATWEGLSRFDGEFFRNYGTFDGLAVGLMNAIAEDRWGRLWIATHGGGVAQFVAEAASARTFIEHPLGTSRESGFVFSIVIDEGDRVWCVAEDGVYGSRIDSAGAAPFEAVAMPGDDGAAAGWLPFLDDGGRAWFLKGRDLARVEGGIPVGYTLPDTFGVVREWVAAGDGHGAWLVASRGVFEISAVPSSVTARLILADSSPDLAVRSACRGPSGVVWLGTKDGLLKLDGRAPARYTRSHGLSDDWIRCVKADSDGNLWIGTHLGGVCRLSGEMIMSYGREQGLADANVTRVLESRDGRIYVTTDRGGLCEVLGDRVALVPGSESSPFHHVHHRIAQDRRGDWWVGTDEGLYRFDGPDLQLRRGRRFGPEDGIPSDAAVFGQIHEDPGGAIWFGTFDNSLYRCDPGRGGGPAFDRIDLAAIGFSSAPRVFLTDRSGALWLAPFVGLWRRTGDRFVSVGRPPGIPDPDMNTRFLYQDRRGRLWIALRFHGVAVTEGALEPESLSFVNYSTRNGMSSDAVWSIAEDEAGRIYLGTGRGVDVLDPATGRFHRVTTADGLAGDIVNDCMRDRNGFIWFGTSQGVSRLDPRARRAPASPPPVYIHAVEIAGVEVPIPETGSLRVAGLVIPPSRNNLAIEFAGVGFVGAPLTYEWKLDGEDARWRRPSRSREVQFARLSSGSFRFMVRAVNEAGMRSTVPAVVEFRILPPVWKRWWFLTVSAVLLAGSAYLLHRARVRRALAMERIRRQISTDLHDDLGSGLSEIAILSEVAKRSAGPAPAKMLEDVASLARAMRESMSDIVWAVDPRKDRLLDLIRRMRQATFNLLEADGVRVEFSAPEESELQGIALPPDRRRQFLLIFKEAVTNVARHAGARSVEVAIEFRSGRLRMEIRDDGCGFDPATCPQGQGLSSLRRRAEEVLGGRFVIESSPGGGTRIEASAPASSKGRF
jgi:signal transduction histidine kinase/ligand-binding sensor domain-containing protein